MNNSERLRVSQTPNPRCRLEAELTRELLQGVRKHVQQLLQEGKDPTTIFVDMNGDPIGQQNQPQQQLPENQERFIGLTAAGFVNQSTRVRRI